VIRGNLSEIAKLFGTIKYDQEELMQEKLNFFL